MVQWRAWLHEPLPPPRVGSLHSLIDVNLAALTSLFSARCFILCQLLNELVSHVLIWGASFLHLTVGTVSSFGWNKT